MATTYVSYTVTATGGSGSVTNPDFSYAAISLLTSSTLNDIDQLVVSLNGDVLTASTDYTVDEGDEEVTISATVAEDDIVLIERVTSIESPIVDYANNAILDKDNLNDSNQQLLYKLQELANDTSNTITLDLTSNCWDLQGKRACNGVAASASSDLTTLGQVQNLIAGAETATVDNLTQWEFTGDGSETDFVLTDAPSGLLDESQLMVFVEGLRQRASGYSLTVSGSTKTLVFSTAPVDDARIAIITAQGIVSAVLASDTIDGFSIVNDSVDGTKINIGSGDAGRIWLFNANGDPSASVPVHTNISDFDTGVRQNRLDQMAAPTSAVSMNSNKITDLTAGSSGSTNACNVAQMEAYADAAAASAASTVNLSSTAQVSTNISLPYERSNAGSESKLVLANVDSSSGDVTVQVKDSGGSYITVAVLNHAHSFASFLVQGGGSYKFTDSGGGNAISYLTEQAF